jgi:predicted nucleic acid-binding protein
VTQYVVDCSVAIKWLVPEIHWEAAQVLRSPDNRLLAPDHFRVEVANVLWKKARSGELTPAEATARAVAVAEMAVETVALASLIEPAFAISLRNDRSVYDALYVALALREGCQFVTADRRLYNSLSPAYPGAMTWIEDLLSG